MDIQLVVFDVDGTLTQHSSIWWRLHELFGTTKEGRVYFDQYFAGKINYQQWADYDAALWTGKPVDIVLEAVRNTKLVPGAQEAVSILTKHNIHSAILSGGLDIMADDIAERIGIDYVLTNKLGRKNGFLTGTVENVIGWAEKAEHIGKITDHFGVTLKQTAFIGDGRNDISVFSVVGLSIAFNPEHQEVAEAANVVVREKDLRAILPHIISEYQ
ncbi:MAG: HAD family phosphatase [Candidatus Thorarchaeota archaeon]|nr:HAD family phosphatase [Candidatus Thorarchaeota archaeon]